MRFCDHPSVLKVRRAETGDAASCAAIVRGLPDHFTDDVAEKVSADLGMHPGWVVTDANHVVGFAIVDRRSQRAAEIRWMAVAKAAQGAGAGTLLLDHLLNQLAGDGLQVMEVKTLDRSADYEPYVATRAFWERRGFVQIDTIDPLPGWQPGNPSAIYVAAVAPTR
jgi:GNAT superfamily N-acetyltransferase